MRVLSRMAAMSRSGIRPPRVASPLPATPATGTVYARSDCLDALHSSFGVGRDLVEDHPQPGAIVGRGVELGDEDRVEGGRRPGQQEFGDPVNAYALLRLQFEVRRVGH